MGLEEATKLEVTDTGLVSGDPSTHTQVCLFRALQISGSKNQLRNLSKCRFLGPTPDIPNWVRLRNLHLNGAHRHSCVRTTSLEL